MSMFANLLSETGLRVAGPERYIQYIHVYSKKNSLVGSTVRFMSVITSTALHYEGLLYSTRYCST